MTGTRPLSRHQILENRAFLRALRRTGNVREAARELGLHRSTMTKRRAKHPGFAVAWDGALAVASAAARVSPGARAGTPRVVRMNGRLQLRRAVRGRLTRAAQQAFLLALSASANIRLAAAAGFSHSAFYRLAERDAGFAREMRDALAAGYQRLKEAAAAGALAGSGENDDWRHNDVPELPRMTANQMLQLLYLHQKEVMLATPHAIKRKRGEPREAYHYRMTALAEARLQRDRDRFDVAEAMRRAAGESPYFEPVVLPALDQVTGWSAASGKPPVDDGVALFGGHRVKHLSDEEYRKARIGREAAWWGVKLDGPKRG